MKRVLALALILIAVPVAAQARPKTLSLTVDHGVSLKMDGVAASVFIANPDIADVQVMSPGEVMIFGKRTGETTFMATDSNGKTLAERTVVVTQDLSELRQEINAAIPGNAIKATPVPNGIVLTGTAKNPTAVADAYKIAMRYMPAGGDIINRIEVVGSNQIMIRVRFAEVQRSINNSFGFNWQNLLSAHNFTVGLAVNNPVSASFPRPNNTTLSLPNDVLGLSTKIGSFSIDGMIDALAQDGLLTILAEPNLTAMSGETANFLAGGQFPIPIPQGNGTISVQFQPYGISLAFTPTLLSGDRISLHVRPEVSELTTAGSIVLGNISVPALTTRKAETTVEVASGESFAIAGLMDNDQAQTVNKFPLLGDMPVLGALFRDSNYQNGQTELVVIITPYVVKPSKQQLALPTDGLAPPSEVDRLVGLRNTSSDPDARPMSGDPTAVLASPAAAPVAPVTTTPTAMEPVSENAAPVLAPAPAATASAPSDAPSPAPVMAAPPATPPLVLHLSGDADKRSGGLLVE